jgi:predicted dehydrogenase
MPSGKLRIGVTGLGRVGWEHCKTLATHADYAFVGVADPVEERRQEAVTTFGCAAFATHEELIKGGHLDAIAIASPTHLHRAMAVTALEAGLHVFLEKPMAVTLADAEAIAQAAKDAKRVLTIYQPHRLMAYYQQVKQVIASGKLGTVYQVKRGGFGWVRRNDWQTLQKFGGGMLSNHGAHFIDQMFDLTGSDVDRMFCRLGRVASMGDAEDVVKLVYQTKAGMLADLEINQAVPRNPYELEISGSHGSLWKDKNTLQLRYLRPEELPDRKLEESLASAGRQYPRDNCTWHDETIEVDQKHTIDVWADLAKAIRTGGEPFVKPAETLAVMRMMERCRSESKGILVTPI